MLAGRDEKLADVFTTPGFGTAGCRDGEAWTEGIIVKHYTAALLGLDRADGLLKEPILDPAEEAQGQRNCQ
jgi:hypothetical protein